MAEWSAKRFWKETTVGETDGGYQVLLDGRSVKTPAKTPLIVPTAALAGAIAEEWDAQEGKINPETMPVTRAANAALDKVRPQRAEVVEMLAAYGGTDLLCYRATEPLELIARQSEAWDPLLGWLEESHGVRLSVASGVMYLAQEPEAEAALHALVDRYSEFEVAAFHDLVAMSGSLVLSLAVADGQLGAAEAWALSRIDETWQEEQWGIDEEAAELAERKKGQFLSAARNFGLARQT